MVFKAGQLTEKLRVCRLAFFTVGKMKKKYIGGLPMGN